MNDENDEIEMLIGLAFERYAERCNDIERPSIYGGDDEDWQWFFKRLKT